ncbi:MAG TPA: hypothetical protein VGO46_06500 [Gemmatimonadaceae bacterium]|nr:hypothetical protein [Gemmatimonadaceae bacterium]
MWHRKNKDVSVTLRVTNSLATRRTLVIEPWLNEYAMPPGTVLDVTFTGDREYRLGVEIEGDRFVLFGFDSKGATMSVKDNGVEAQWLRPNQ